jgi:hypothetical protein
MVQDSEAEQPGLSLSSREKTAVSLARHRRFSCNRLFGLFGRIRDGLPTPRNVLPRARDGIAPSQKNRAKKRDDGNESSHEGS